MPPWKVFGRRAPQANGTTDGDPVVLAPPAMSNAQPAGLSGVKGKRKTKAAQQRSIHMLIFGIVSIIISGAIAWNYLRTPLPPDFPYNAWRNMRPFKASPRPSVLFGVRNRTQEHAIHFTTTTTVFLDRHFFTSPRYKNISAQIRLADTYTRDLMLSTTNIEDSMNDGLLESTQLIETANRDLLEAIRLKDNIWFQFRNTSLTLLHASCRWTVNNLSDLDPDICAAVSPPTAPNPQAIVLDLIASLLINNVKTHISMSPALTSFSSNHTLALRAMENARFFADSDWRRDELSKWECGVKDWGCTRWSKAAKAGPMTEPYFGMLRFFAWYEDAVDQLKSDAQVVKAVEKRHLRAARALGALAENMMGREMTADDVGLVLLQVARWVALPHLSEEAGYHTLG